MAIFVIVAIILVIGIGLALFLRQDKPIISFAQGFDSEQYMDSCVKKAINDKAPLLLEQGGLIDPTDYKLSENVKATYLCKNINYYEPCINQYPRYITHLQQELSGAVKDDVAGCISTLKSELEKRNYDVSMSAEPVQLILKPGIVEARVPAHLKATKSSETKTYDQFSNFVRSPVYDLGSVAQEIASQEAQYCYFEYVGYSLIYSDFNIKLKTFSDSTKVYTIKHIPTENVMNIAIRGCALPAGF